MDANGERRSGCFVAVAGPSGAGKDTIIDAARLALRGDARFHFVRRVVTRSSTPGIEDHDSLDEAAFAAAAEAGAFALRWRAHGLDYGLPAGLRAALDAGRVVVANVSRHVLPEARRIFPVHAVVLITARPEVRAGRLAARGRESRADIESRLARDVPPEQMVGDATVIDNSGALDDAVRAFLGRLEELAAESAA